MFVKQIEVGGFAVFAYIVACKKTNEALVIDPAAEGDRIFKEATDRGYKHKVHRQHPFPCGPYYGEQADEGSDERGDHYP